jgi:hypothetical protein
MILKKSKDVVVELRVVRSYMTTAEVRKNHGIFANFSAKLIINDTTIITLNDLQVRTSRDGDVFIGSPGRKLDRGYLSFVSFYSGEENDDNKETKDNFVSELVEEVKSFYRNAQAALHTKEKDYSQPKSLADWEAYEKPEAKETEDTPF